MGFTTVDYIIVVGYLLAVALIGILSAGKQTSTTDYFLGRRDLPWLAVCFAIVATETSTLTFISIPGLAYATNLNFLQVTFGYLLGRIAVSFLLLPAYARGELTTAYQFLGTRFGPRIRRLTSGVFMATRLLADGVRLYATAIPLALLLSGWKQLADVGSDQVYVIAILILAAITLSYTYIGGVRAVIWTDVVQMFIYLTGAAGALIVILSSLPETIIPWTQKLSVLNMGWGLSWTKFLETAYTLPAGLLGGAFLSMASHGTDQIIVQRLLTVRTLAGSRKALIGSGILVIIQFALFMLIGVLLYVFYGGASIGDLGLSRGDEIFPRFIIDHIPSGLSGLIIAGLLAAAMSTLSGSVNSLASATVHDIYIPLLGRETTAHHQLRVSRLASLFWCILLVGTAMYFISISTGFLVELALGIASVTYGGLLGTFLLGVLSKKVGERDATIGFLAGIAVMFLLFLRTELAWTWYTLAGTLATILTGAASARLLPAGRT